MPAHMPNLLIYKQQKARRKFNVSVLLNQTSLLELVGARCPKEKIRANWSRFFTDWTPFLLPNWQCPDTEGRKRNWEKKMPVSSYSTGRHRMHCCCLLATKVENTNCRQLANPKYWPQNCRFLLGGSRSQQILRTLGLDNPNGVSITSSNFAGIMLVINR